MQNKIKVTYYKSVLAEFIIGTLDNKCCLFEFKDRKTIASILDRIQKKYHAEFVYTETELHKQIISEFEEYLQGQRQHFTFPIMHKGTEFQKKVWHALQTIPYGETRSYKDIAEQIGNPNAVRAVGSANGANNLAVIIPCHRVIHSNGNLQGYGGGLPRKQKLLNLEQRHIRQLSLDEFAN